MSRLSLPSLTCCKSHSRLCRPIQLTHAQCVVRDRFHSKLQCLASQYTISISDNAWQNVVCAVSMLRGMQAAISSNPWSDQHLSLKFLSISGLGRFADVLSLSFGCRGVWSDLMQCTKIIRTTVPSTFTLCQECFLQQHMHILRYSLAMHFRDAFANLQHSKLCVVHRSNLIATKFVGVLSYSINYTPFGLKHIDWTQSMHATFEACVYCVLKYFWCVRGTISGKGNRTNVDFRCAKLNLQGM